MNERELLFENFFDEKFDLMAYVEIEEREPAQYENGIMVYPGYPGGIIVNEYIAQCRNFDTASFINRRMMDSFNTVDRSFRAWIVNQIDPDINETINERLAE